MLQRFHFLNLLFQFYDIAGKAGGFFFLFSDDGFRSFIGKAWVRQLVLHALLFFFLFFDGFVQARNFSVFINK